MSSFHFIFLLLVGSICSNKWAFFEGEKLVNCNNSSEVGCSHSFSYTKTNSKIFLYGGILEGNFSNSLWEYDFSSQFSGWIWKELSFSNIKPERNAGGGLWISTNEKQLFGFGGNTQNEKINDFWVYSLETSEYTPLHENKTAQELPSPRDHFTYFRDPSEDLFYIIGGENKDSQLLSDVWQFNLSTGNWTQLLDNGLDFNGDANNPAARKDASFWISDGKVYLFGGKTISGSTNDIWEFDLTLRTFNRIMEHKNGLGGVSRVFEPSNYPLGRSSSFVWVDPFNSSYVNIYGGYTTSQTEACSDLWFLDTENWLWKSESSETCAFEYKNQTTDSPKLVFSDTVTPGRRSGGVAFTSGNANNYIHLFGGYAFDSDGNHGGSSSSFVYAESVCFDQLFHDSEVCTSNGLCVDLNTCECSGIWRGAKCEEEVEGSSMFNNEITSISISYKSNLVSPRSDFECIEIFNTSNDISFFQNSKCSFSSNYGMFNVDTLKIDLEDNSLLCPSDYDGNGKTYHNLLISDGSYVEIEFEQPTDPVLPQVTLPSSITHCEDDSLLDGVQIFSPDGRELSYDWKVVLKSDPGTLRCESSEKNFNLENSCGSLVVGSEYIIKVTSESFCGIAQAGESTLTCTSGVKQPETTVNYFEIAFLFVMENLPFFILGCTVVIALIIILFIFILLVLICLKFRALRNQASELESPFVRGRASKGGYRKRLSGKQDIELEAIKIPITVPEDQLFTIKISDITNITTLRIPIPGIVLATGTYKLKKVGLKIFNCAFIDDFKGFCNSLEKEHKLLKESTNKENILDVIGICNDYPRIIVVSEHYDRNLKKLIPLLKGKISWGKKLRIVHQIANGVKFLHSKKLIHRYLTPECVVFDENNNVRIGDYFANSYLAQEATARQLKVFGSYYQAPEFTLEGKKIDFDDEDDIIVEDGSTEDLVVNKDRDGIDYNEKIDTFSLGVIMYELLVEKLGAFDNSADIAYKIAKDENLRPELPESIKVDENNDWYIRLMSKCMENLSYKRDTFAKLVQIIGEQVNYNK